MNGKNSLSECHWHRSPPGARSTGGAWLLPVPWPAPSATDEIRRMAGSADPFHALSGFPSALRAPGKPESAKRHSNKASQSRCSGTEKGTGGAGQPAFLPRLSGTGAISRSRHGLPGTSQRARRSSSAGSRRRFRWTRLNGFTSDRDSWRIWAYGLLYRRSFDRQISRHWQERRNRQEAAVDWHCGKKV